MSDMEGRKDLPLVSICIPTFNRAEALTLCLGDLITNKQSDIEIVVSDNGSTDNTESVMKQFQDEGIRYFRNEKNLGFDLNLIKTVEHARGEYVFFLSDEDYVDYKNILWLLEQIRQKKTVTQFLGTTINKQKNIEKIYNMYGDITLKQGCESLNAVLFECSYMSGIVLKKDSLDLNKAKDYVSCAYMFVIFQAQAMLKGDTVCSSKIFCYQGKEHNLSYDKDEKQKSSIIGNPIANPYHYLSRVHQLKELIKLVYEVTDDIKTRHILFNKLRNRIAVQLAASLFISLNQFKDFISKVSQIREVWFSPYFWIFLLKHITIKAVYNITRQK